MTDYERTVEFLKSLGLEVGRHMTDFNDPEPYLGATRTLSLAPTRDQKVIGYSASFAEFRFDQDGKFVNVGVWEG